MNDSITLINYIEFKCHNLDKTEAFYSETFGWNFKTYGPSYRSFSDSGVEGGFEATTDEIVNGTLVILHHTNLELIKEKIMLAGGTISLDIFSFPGGSRFHFLDPSGNELAVWCAD